MFINFCNKYFVADFINLLILMLMVSYRVYLGHEGFVIYLLPVQFAVDVLDQVTHCKRERLIEREGGGVREKERERERERASERERE